MGIRQYFLSFLMIGTFADASPVGQLTLAPGFTLQQDGRSYVIAGIVPAPGFSRHADAWLSGTLAHRRWQIRTVGWADRYGRRPLVATDEQSGDLAEAMVEAGQALADASSRDETQARRLLARENEARAAHRGLWREPPVYSPESVTAAIGRYGIVEGRVRAVSQRKGSVFLDFGDDWRTDTTAFVPAGMVSRFPPGFLDGLASRRIAVRGWIESRHGPSIAILEPWAIEPLDEPSGALRHDMAK